MKTLLVNLQPLGITFSDIQPVPGTRIMKDDVAKLDKAVYEVLESSFPGADEDPYMLKPFVPATKLSQKPSPYLWDPINWQFGALNPAEVLDFVLGWNTRVLDELNRAIDEYRGSGSRQARIINAQKLAVVAKNTLDEPDLDREWFVVDGRIMDAFVSKDVAKAVEADPSKWAILRIA